MESENTDKPEIVEGTSEIELIDNDAVVQMADGAVTPAGQPAALSRIRIEGGTIYLPESRKVSVHSEEYHLILKETLPSEISKEVVAVLTTPEKKRSRALSFISIAVMVAMVFVFVYFLPKPRGVESIISDISSAGLEQEGHKYDAVLETAEAHYKLGNYNQCEEVLASVAVEISGDKSAIHENGKLLFMYLDSIRKTKMTLERFAVSGRVLNNLCNNDADCIQWWQFKLEILHKEIMNPRELYYRRERYKESDIRAYREHAEVILGVIDRNVKNKPEYTGETKDFFDVAEIKLLISDWILLAQEADDWTAIEEGPGVMQREKAYSLAKSFEGRKILELVDLQLFIVNTIIDQDGSWYWAPWRPYYFNGQRLRRQNSTNDYDEPIGLIPEKKRLEKLREEIKNAVEKQSSAGRSK